MKSLAISIMIFLGGCAEALASDSVDFVNDVRPILEKHCYQCHGPSQQKSGLRLDIKQLAFQGGDGRGAAILPGDSSKSPILELIRSTEPGEQMPPKGERLSAHETEIIAEWIEQGAHWPDGVDLATIEDKRDHWSLKPLLDFDKPEAALLNIDSFIDQRLEQAGLERSHPATPATWLRRVSLDLTGLPPTPEELSAFVNQSTPDYEAEVTRLLSSPRYGERWGQYWLDVVRYADTHGFEVNTERPNAWPYRDYVIRALNNDTPYDRFVQEQIVGDALGQDAATGFLVTASVLLPGQIGKDAPSIRLARQDSLDEMVNNISQTFLGLSIGCARCHDHKFDPISQRDYYGLQAIVAGVEYEDREIRTADAEQRRKLIPGWKEQLAAVDGQLTNYLPIAQPADPSKDSLKRRQSVNWRLTTDRVAPVATKRLKFTILATNSLEPCLDELEVINDKGQNIALASLGTQLRTSGDTLVAERHAPQFVHDGVYGNSSSWMSNEAGKGWVELEFPQTETLQRIVWSRDRLGRFDDRLPTEYRIEADVDGRWQLIADSSDRHPFVAGATADPLFSTEGLSPEDTVKVNQLLSQKSTIEANIRGAEIGEQVFAGKFREPDEIHLLTRGDPEQPKGVALPAMPSALGEYVLARETPEQDRRKALADWIISPSNPLTARVMVNRIWQGHFGVGLVATPSDFGHNGMKPSHPILLDWLASEFIRKGWSMKEMHRMMVLSETYKQSSRFDPDAAKVDADSRLLWRFPPRRLEAETIRDSMLAVSGQLNTKMYGRGFDLFDQRGGLSGFKPVESFRGDGLRRMIYAHKVRREREAVFGAFDCPDAGQSTALRSESTTPIQALNLLNSQFTLDASQAFAERIRHESLPDVSHEIDRAFQLAFARKPTAEELQEIEPIVHHHGLVELCRAILNSNEFLYLP